MHVYGLAVAALALLAFSTAHVLRSVLDAAYGALLGGTAAERFDVLRAHPTSLRARV